MIFITVLSHPSVFVSRGEVVSSRALFSVTYAATEIDRSTFRSDEHAYKRIRVQRSSVQLGTARHSERASNSKRTLLSLIGSFDAKRASDLPLGRSAFTGFVRSRLILSSLYRVLIAGWQVEWQMTRLPSPTNEDTKRGRGRGCRGVERAIHRAVQRRAFSE